MGWAILLLLIAIAGGGGWWMAKRAQRHVSQAVAVRVIALLAMNGLCAGPAGLRAMAVAFRSIEGMRAFNDLDGETLRKYQQDWLRLKPAWRGDLQNAPAVVESIERPHTSSASSRLADNPSSFVRVAFAVSKVSARRKFKGRTLRPLKQKYPNVQWMTFG